MEIRKRMSLASLNITGNPSKDTTEREFIYFKVAFNHFRDVSGSTAHEVTDKEELAECECVLCLPPSYRETGAKTPLILSFHGAGGKVNAERNRIGGVAFVTECIDAGYAALDVNGSELSLDPGFVPTPLDIPGVTDTNGQCDAVFFTHYHGDHMGQMTRIRQEIPLYAGALAKDIMRTVAERDLKKNEALYKRIQAMRTFNAGESLVIGDIKVTPFSVDHSACDSYMFLIEAEGKRVLHTGDFRMHGFRGKALPKLLQTRVGKVDLLITEGTCLSREQDGIVTERDLQQRAIAYMQRYKYVFVWCATTNLERICALSKAVPRGKYFVCDETQADLLELITQHWGGYSLLYRDLKCVRYGDNLLPSIRQHGCLMMVRDNGEFRRILRKFDPAQSVMLYSMWDGYRTRDGSTAESFLVLAGRWEPFHTSGHATKDALKTVIEIINPNAILPIHTDAPIAIKALCPNRNVLTVKDKEVITL